MERQRIEHCLERVSAYRASGQKAKEWGPANGVSIRELASWCAHSSRWQAGLDGVTPEPVARAAGAGFVAAGLPAGASTTVRVEVAAGSTTVAVHWPMSHARELAAWLRELAR